MTQRRITKRLVDGLQATDRDYIIWDGALPGFGVRVRPSGSKSYVVQYRAGREALPLPWYSQFHWERSDQNCPSTDGAVP